MRPQTVTVAFAHSVFDKRIWPACWAYQFEEVGIDLEIETVCLSLRQMKGGAEYRDSNLHRARNLQHFLKRLSQPKVKIISPTNFVEG